MKAIVFSDSHGYLNNLDLALKNFKNEIDCLIHLGDFFEDTKEIKKNYKDLEIFAVSGNNDFINEPSEKVFYLNNFKVFVTHGHRYNVYFGVENLRYRALELDANICLFGHSHNPFIENKDLFILNPGSISYPRQFDFPTFSIINLEDNKVSADIFYIVKNEILKFNKDS